jgi:propionyl-CoA synthetase
MTIGDRYHAAFRQSLEDPDAFWAEAARAIDWNTPPPRVLDADRDVVARLWHAAGRVSTRFDERPPFASADLRR